jgi:hypothetical protein
MKTHFHTLGKQFDIGRHTAGVSSRAKSRDVSPHATGMTASRLRSMRRYANNLISGVANLNLEQDFGPHGVSSRAKSRDVFQTYFRAKKNGGAKGDRTPDLLNAIQALSQLSYGPTPLDKDNSRFRRRGQRDNVHECMGFSFRET